MPKTFKATVARTADGVPQAGEFTEEVSSISIGSDGRLILILANGRSQSLSPTSWGAFKVVRVASSEARLA